MVTLQAVLLFRDFEFPDKNLLYRIACCNNLQALLPLCNLHAIDFVEFLLQGRPKDILSPRGAFREGLYLFVAYHKSPLFSFLIQAGLNFDSLYYFCKAKQDDNYDGRTRLPCQSDCV